MSKTISKQNNYVDSKKKNDFIQIPITKFTKQMENIENIKKIIIVSHNIYEYLENPE